MVLPLVGQGELGRKEPGGRTPWPRGGWDRGYGIKGLGVEEGQFKRDRVLGNSETDSWESRCCQQMKTLDFYPVDNSRTPKDLWTKGSCGHKCPISQVDRAVIQRWRKEPRRAIGSQSAGCGKRTVIWLSRELGPRPSVTTNHTSDVQEYQTAFPPARPSGTCHRIPESQSCQGPQRSSSPGFQSPAWEINLLS